MRRPTSSDGFLIGYLISVMWNIGWGLLALILWGLHYLLGLPLFFAFIAILVWLVKALVSTSLVYWAARSADSPTPRRKNRNPYSAKDGDMFPAPQKPDKNAKEQDKREEEPEAVYIDARSALYVKMLEAASLIGVPKDFFIELMRQAVSGERDPDFITENKERVSSEDVVYWFFEGLLEHRYLGYHNWNAPYAEIAASLSESASLQGLPEIPEALLRQTTEAAGLGAIISIASVMDEWCVFVVEDGSDWRMVGAVSRENAERFHSVMNLCCELAGSGYKIGLLRRMDAPTEQKGEDERSYRG